MYNAMRFGESAQRGLYVAQWMGPEGELVLVSITSKRRKLNEVMIPHGADRVTYAERMRDELDLADPDPTPQLRLA